MWIHRDDRTNELLPVVNIALLPTADGWQPPIYRGFGNTNDSPFEEVNALALRHDIYCPACIEDAGSLQHRAAMIRGGRSWRFRWA